MPNKVVVFGVGQSNFLSFLYSKLKLNNPEFSISIPTIRNISTNVTYQSWMYDNDTIKYKIGFFIYLQSLLFLLCNIHFYQTFFFILFVEKKPLKSFHFIASSIKEKSFFLANNNFKEFDTFHFHYIQYSYIRELFWVPNNKKIVCTFWGSDLLRTSDILNFYLVKKALKKADIITTQSMELKEIILSKFGRDLNDKIKIAIFPLEESTFNSIKEKRYDLERISMFKKKYNYELNKINIQISHNGNPLNNHLKILDGLSKSNVLDKIHIIINLNYAINKLEKEKYSAKILNKIKAMNVSYTLLEEYFEESELPYSRLSTDIFIHMPISDALSNTMIEMMYSQAIVITGAWLPYKILKQYGINYFETIDYESLSLTVEHIILNYDKIKQEKTLLNPEIIDKNLLGNNLLSPWIEILK